jgi:hypothetical protein
MGGTDVKKIDACALKVNRFKIAWERVFCDKLAFYLNLS